MNLLAPAANSISPFLAGLSKPDLDAVLSSATRRDFPSRVVITEEGAAARNFFVLTSGRARYFFISRAGRKVILHWIGHGEIVGGMSLLADPMSYVVSAETVKPTSMLVWKRDTIRHLFGLYPKLLDNALSFMLQYLVLYRIRYAELIYGNAPERLAAVLSDLTKCIGHPVNNGIEVQVTNEDLASAANVTSFTACRFLNDWQRNGLLAKKRGRIIVFTPAKLLLKAAAGEKGSGTLLGGRQRENAVKSRSVALIS